MRHSFYLAFAMLVVGCTVDSGGIVPDDCVPDDCEGRCGDVSDGCGGTLFCGSCDGCVRTTCELEGAECGPLFDGCDQTLDCGRCDAPEGCIENMCRCVPKTCDDLGAMCGEPEDGCGGTLECGGCDAPETCIGGQCACDGRTCEKRGNPGCGLFWDACEEEILECGDRCDEDETCVEDKCQTLAESRVVINEFSIQFRFAEILGAPETKLGRYALLLVEGDQEANPGLVRSVVRFTGDGSDELDEWGYVLVDLQTNHIKEGTSTLLLVSDFNDGGIAPRDIDSNNDGIIDLQPWALAIDAVGVHDGDYGDYTYAGDAELRTSFDGRTGLVHGASRIPNGVDTDKAADWVRNARSGFGVLDGVPSPPAGVAINTPHEETLYEAPGYNIAVE